MKQLMLGNKALARGLYEAGCSVVSSYPGTPSTEVTEEAAKYDEIYCEWAPNEKVAMEVAFGASLAGKRSFCGMKHVGLNVAADPLFTCSYTGVNGGMVICVADDPGMHSSQNEQDSRHHAIASKIPMLEPSDSTEAYEFAKKAFELSEEFDTPVIIKMCTRVAHSQSIVEPGERVVPETIPYEKNIAKYVMMPGNAIRRHPVVEERTRKLIEYGNHCDFNRVEMGDTKLGIITSSTCYQYAKEVFGDKASILKIGLVNPLPDQLILDFAAKVEKLAIIEELDPILENHCKELGLTVTGKDALPMEGEFSQNLIAEKLGIEVPAHKELGEALPGRPPVMCAGCPHRGLFFTLSKNKCTVLGDIGCYTLGAVAPLSVVDTTICMGASISSLHGMEKAKGKEYIKNWVAVIGDSTFLHTGVNSLMNMMYNKATGTVIILDNSTTGMTGHQDHAATGKTLQGDPTYAIDIPALCRAIGVKNVVEVNARDIQAVEKAVKEEIAKDEVSVIITKTPCVLLDKSKKPLYQTHTDKCKKCGMCMKPGCPAMTKNADGTISIDDTMCTGCGLCAS
ncbi:indolepyruvate ferredoxin oxidoreductase subunit alpha, partial [Anaerobutyricum hallii]|uniref:indolepyruvate ferredoxin oxidoreductase subunit alpha n=1 Tax=Anaerobutyricum hallii TaxID=39488 RepID=UPI00242CF9A3